MVNFIKISSLIIILLFFPISFYFNIIPINCDSEDDFKVEMRNCISNPEGYGRLYKFVYRLFIIFFLENR